MHRDDGGKLELPVFVNFNEHVMGKARIVIDGNNVDIVIHSEGQDGLTLANFLLGGEPVSLSFQALPVTQHRSPRQ